MKINAAIKSSFQIKKTIIILIGLDKVSYYRNSITNFFHCNVEVKMTSLEKMYFTDISHLSSI